MTVNLPIANCRTAALHQINTVQSFGVLVAIHADSHLITYCSSNAGDFFEQKPGDLLGQPATAWLGKSWSALASLAALEGRIQVAAFAGPARCPRTVAGHRRGSHLLLEFEPTSSATVDFWNHAKRSELLEQLSAVRTTDQCYQFVVRWVSDATGYDRVMLYRFLKGWHGEVVNEQVLNAQLFITCVDHPDTLTGLRMRFEHARFQGHAIAAPAEANVAAGWLSAPLQFCWQS